MIECIKSSFFCGRNNEPEADTEAILLESDGRSVGLEDATRKTSTVMLDRESGKKLDCRVISPIDNEQSFCIKIKVSDTYNYQLNLPSLELIELSLVKFSVDGRVFSKIDGNYPDKEIALAIKDSTHKDMYFVIDNGYQGQCLHSVDNQFKNNFLRCISEGMISLYTLPDFTNTIDSHTGKTYGELLGDNVTRPTCTQFARFVKYDFDDYSNCPDSIFEQREIAEKDDLPFFSLIAIKSNNFLIHEFIHIAHELCLEKMGVSSIVFIQLDQIVKHYKKYLQLESLKLVQLTKRE